MMADRAIAVRIAICFMDEIQRINQARLTRICRKPFALGGLLLVPLLARGGESPDAELFFDDFRNLPPGMLVSEASGALAEYHYLPVTAPKGNWAVSTFTTDPASQRAWRVRSEDGRLVLCQTWTAPSEDRAYTHPMLVAGDSLWSDYRLETTFAPQADDGGMTGVLVRYRNDRRYYFAGVTGQNAVLKRVDQGSAFHKLNETVLAEQPFSWKPGEFIPLTIQVTGPELRASFGRTNGLTLAARDATFAEGRIGLTADQPAQFGAVRVAATADAKQKFEAARAARQADEERRVAANPRMVLWRKLSLGGFGVGRCLRFGDLNGDGRVDVLFAQQRRHGPKDRNSEVGCLTAMTFEGEILWQNGQPDPWNDRLSNDVAVQIHDLDGDGRNEVVYCRDFQIVVADGATGKTRYQAPTPEAPPDPQHPSLFPRILGDSLLFADLRGIGARRDLVLKDRYRNLWAYNDRLEPLWTLTLNAGHYAFPYDINGDGREELAVGYALVNPAGRVLWSNESVLQDHADGVAIVRFKEGTEPRVLCAASDEGIFFADLQGHIQKHHQLGHVQNPTVADFRPDLPGLETVTVNFWGNQGIIHFFDADGNLYHDCEPAQHGSMMLPVNWTGRPGEFWALSPNAAEGGLYDGWGRRAVRFPVDGHPDRCVAALDVTGDCRDELVVWDPGELWVYTQSDNPKSGRLYRPRRNPLYNESNYRANVSLPGWSE
jgi:rhamnogalacturonan endolyase